MLIDIERVSRLLREVAETEVAPRFGRLAKHEVRRKTADELVTVADEAAEKALSRGLLSLLPGSVTVGEEEAAADPGVMRRIAGGDPVWLIDPIDGTRNYAAGKHPYAMMVALTRGGAAEAAWIFEPGDGRLVVAERGAGAWRGGTRLSMPPGPPSPTLTVAFNFFAEDRRDALRARARALGTLADRSCAGRVYTRMAEGAQHFALFSKMMPWDHVPGTLIVIEAGGHVAKWDGTPYRPTDMTGGILAASDPATWKRLRDALAE